MLVFAAFALAASGSAALAKQYSSVVLSDHGLSYAKVRVGEPVEIRLKAQGGTGYSWRATNYPGKIKELSTNPAGMPGGKEVQRFRFKSNKKGTYVVNFSYGQPWKGGEKGAKRRSFTIKVID
jgi:predicted secreted protein